MWYEEVNHILTEEDPDSNTYCGLVHRLINVYNVYYFSDYIAEGSSSKIRFCKSCLKSRKFQLDLLASVKL